MQWEDLTEYLLLSPFNIHLHFKAFSVFLLYRDQDSKCCPMINLGRHLFPFSLNTKKRCVDAFMILSSHLVCIVITDEIHKVLC